jgi:hypothetical protein
MRRNMGLTAITWFFQAILGGVVGLILAIPAALMAVPIMLTSIQSGNIPTGLLIGLFLYAILANTLVGGLLTAFNSALWTMVFRTFVLREQSPAPAPYGTG